MMLDWGVTLNDFSGAAENTLPACIACRTMFYGASHAIAAITPHREGVSHFLGGPCRVHRMM